MKKLLDAFLDLPTWQGMFLIASVFGVGTAVALIVNRIAWQRGWDACRARWEGKAQAAAVNQVSERI